MLLPLVSGYTLFILTVAPAVLVLALLARYRRTAANGPGLLWHFTLLLAPANQTSFDFGMFFDNVALLVVTLLFTVLSFYLILPVSPRRRRARLAHAISGDLRRTLQQGRLMEQATAQSLHYDRLSQVDQWLERKTPGRMAVLHRLYAFAELELALDQTWTALDGALRAVPTLAEPVAAARAAMIGPHPEAMLAAAHALLGHAYASRARGPVLRAVSGLYESHYILQQQGRALRRYGVLGG